MHNQVLGDVINFAPIEENKSQCNVYWDQHTAGIVVYE